MSNFVQNLKRILNEQDINKSRMIEDLGVSRTAFYGYLSGRTQMGADMVEKFAEYLNISPGDLFEVDEIALLKKRIDNLEEKVKSLQVFLEKHG